MHGRVLLSLLLVVFPWMGCGPTRSIPQGLDAGGIDSQHSPSGIDSKHSPDAFPWPDWSILDGSPPCKDHCDCPQEWFCLSSQCVRDPRMPVYCCDNAGCPPGQWCVDSNGQRSLCGEDPAYKCKDACDCGPAHCCKGGRCVKDTLDPWRPGGKKQGSPCKEGQEPTYCCSDPACESGRVSYGHNAFGFFRCLHKPSGKTRRYCRARSCFGTACNCDPHETCLDTVVITPPGKSCLLLSGGTCVSHQMAAAVFGHHGSDLLPCCDTGCTKGTPCEVGWRLDSKRTYSRVVGNCGSCGNSTCDPGEYPATCPKDCKCGDGRCAPSEQEECKADCETCGNGTCEPWESPPYPGSSPLCAVDCGKCGDGWCAAILETEASCPQDCAGRCLDADYFDFNYQVCGDGNCQEDVYYFKHETCRSCARDCGPCDNDWVQVRGAHGQGLSDHSWGDIWGSAADHVISVGHSGMILIYDGFKWMPQRSGTSEELMAVWASSVTDVFAGGESGVILHFDGKKWAPQKSGFGGEIRDIWGSSPTEVFAVGTSGISSNPSQSVILRYDGKAWTTHKSLANTALHGIWGSSSAQVFIVGRTQNSSTSTGLILHYDGKSWGSKQMPLSTTVFGIWGTGASDIYALSSCPQKGSWEVLRFNGQQWSSFQTFNNTNPSPNDIWGSSSSDIFLVGRESWHYNGKVWSSFDKVGPGEYRSWMGIWGSSASDVYIVGWTWTEGTTTSDTMKHYDGSRWSTVDLDYRSGLSGIWGRSPTAIYAVGNAILGYDGKTWKALLPREKGAYPHGFNDVWGISATDLYLVGSRRTGTGKCGGHLGHFNGVSYKVILYASHDFRSSLDHIWSSSPTDIWATGVYTIHYDGLTWPKQSISLGALWGTSATEIYAVAKADVISGLYSLNRYDGTSWKVMAADKTWWSLDSIWGSTSTDIYAVGSLKVTGKSSRPGLILHYDGKSWTALKAGSEERLRDVWGTSPTNVFVLPGEGDAILRYDGKAWIRRGLDLREIAGGIKGPRGFSYGHPRLRALGGHGPGAAFAVGENEVILRHCPGGVCP